MCWFNNASARVYLSCSMWKVSSTSLLTSSNYKLESWVPIFKAMQLQIAILTSICLIHHLVHIFPLLCKEVNEATTFVNLWQWKAANLSIWGNTDRSWGREAIVQYSFSFIACFHFTALSEVLVHDRNNKQTIPAYLSKLQSEYFTL